MKAFDFSSGSSRAWAKRQHITSSCSKYWVVTSKSLSVLVCQLSMNPSASFSESKRDNWLVIAACSSFLKIMFLVVRSAWVISCLGRQHSLLPAAVTLGTQSTFAAVTDLLTACFSLSVSASQMSRENNFSGVAPEMSLVITTSERWRDNLWSCMKPPSVFWFNCIMKLSQVIKGTSLHLWLE